MMKYKALMLDLDNTTIPNSREGMPSDPVTTAIKKAENYLHVGAVTGRPYFSAKPIIDYLKLSGPSILSGGAQIRDNASGEVLWEQPIPLKELQELYPLVTDYDFYISDGGKEMLYTGGFFNGTILQAYINNADPEKAAEIQKNASQFGDLAIHTAKSWEEGKISLMINHGEATKQHGIYEVAKILKIDPAEIIGVGDGGNDFPLLMACGLKIAMGNAADDLKAIADYVAPSVEEDGVAHVIEKFILNA